MTAMSHYHHRPDRKSRLSAERLVHMLRPVGKQAIISRSQHKMIQIHHFHVVSGQKSSKIRPVTTYNMDGRLSKYRSLSSDMQRHSLRAGHRSLQIRHPTAQTS